jgi:hypothetical protein
MTEKYYESFLGLTLWKSNFLSNQRPPTKAIGTVQKEGKERNYFKRKKADRKISVKKNWKTKPLNC